MTSHSTDLGIVDSLVQLSFAVQSVLNAAAARHDLTVGQVRLLGILRDHEPGTMELARHLGLDKSSVTGLIDRAERRGLVQRAPSAEDGRAVLVSATPLGRQLAERGAQEIAHDIAALTAGLNSADRKRLSALASQVVGSTHPHAG